MKKLTLFLVAMTMSLFSFAAQPKRIYAYGLSSTLVDKVYTFSFTANETPTSGKIIFYDATSGDLVGEIALTNPVFGKNEVEIAEYDLPGLVGQQLNWAVELSAAAVTAYEKIFADASPRYRRGHSNVDVSPESDHFGAVYVGDRVKTTADGKFYVYDPVYTIADADGYSLGATNWGFSRFAIAPDGKVWLSDFSDGHSGLWIVDPSNLTTATQFFTGTRTTSGTYAGVIKNNGVDVGSSLSCATLYGKGANTKLVTVGEDYSGYSFPVTIFNVGKADGSLVTSWSTAPSKMFNTLGNGAANFEAKACEKGVWVSTNRGTGSNNETYTSLRFYTWDGECTWSSHNHTDIINGNLGAGFAITPDEKQMVMKVADKVIAIFDITWNGSTPTLTQKTTFNCGYAAVSSINLDYAGNIVTVAGTAWGNTDDKRMSLVVYSNPTTNNTCEVPAKKTDVVTMKTSRAWSYDLELTSEGDSYTFSFKAVTSADATLIFDQDGVEVGVIDCGHVSAGLNTITKTHDELLDIIQKSGDFNWSVKMSGEAIALSGNFLTEITDANEGIYNFYLPQGVTVDNSPESTTFGNIYVAAATDGATDGSSERADTQKRGIFIYDQTLVELNPTSNAGVIPSNVTLTNTTRQAMHRIAVNPKNNHVAFAYNVSGSPAVWSVPANDLDGEATNLIAGTSITMPNSICFDENGALYVMDNANATTGGTIYKVVDGIVTKIAQNTTWQHNDNALAYDGRGGIWIAQSVDNNNWPSYEILSHINSEGNIDWKSSDYKSTLLFSNGNGDGYSKRGQVAYSTKDDLLVFGGNCRSHIFQVTYDETGAPSLGTTYKYRTPYLGSKANIDGAAFDYAGDLYLMSARMERLYKYVVPTNDNTCTTPAKISQVITLVSATPEYNVTINVNGNGTVTGANTGTYLEGTELTLTATAADHYEFTGWTGDVTSTENPLTVTVNSDMNITANFAKKQYTLTVFVNDENKGTIDVTTGSHEYGKEVTLTATPKEGYKLLAWSNKATTPSITLTMDNNKAVSAYFVKEYDVEPTFTITKVWENLDAPASTNNGYQAVGWDGKIYLKDRGNDVISVYSDATTSATYASTDSKDDQSIAVDDAGNLVLRSGSTNFYDAPKQVILYKKGETTYKTINFTLPASGRCDFISASGDLFSAKGGYVYFYCQNQTTVSRLHVKNGGATAGDIVIDAVGAGITGGNSQSHVMVDIFGNLVTHSRTAAINKTINAYTGEATTFTLPNDQKAIALGGCSFELGGKEFWAYNVKGSNICNTEWNLYNMTDKKYLSNEPLYVENKTDKNSAANWLNVQVVDENTAYIYQFCPTVAMAVWKVTIDAEYTYELNGGVTNDYGWMSKDDMFKACMNDGGVTTLPSLTELKALGNDAALTAICGKFGKVAAQKVLDNDKWNWLEEYVMSVQNASSATKLVAGGDPTDNTGWAYAIAAFFIEGQRTTWPVSANFAQAGLDEAYQRAWEHGYDNPTKPTSEFVLNTPYKEDYTFDGWYTTSDFSGEKVTTIQKPTTDITLYAKWIEYIPTIAEVKALADNATTNVAGVVTYISGNEVFVQDPTGGIVIVTATNATCTIGQSIKASGTKTITNGAPQVINATIASAEAGTLPEETAFESLNQLVNDTDLKHYATRITVPGLKVASYDSNGYPILTDGLNTALCYRMPINQSTFPEGTKVVITAVGGWNNGFQFRGDVAGITLAPGIAKDTYAYPERENGKYTLANEWIVSNIEGNYQANKPGPDGYVRAMAATNGKMYFINRETESLTVVDGATGEMLNSIAITGTDIFKVSGVNAVTVAYNDVKVDNAGNILISACVSGGNTFFVYTVDPTTGMATELIKGRLQDTWAGLNYRFDAIGVAGDVTNNGVIMAANANAWEAYRWKINDGVVGTCEKITLTGTGSNPGTAPQIQPLDAQGKQFYVDGSGINPILFNEDGTQAGKFTAGATIRNNIDDVAYLNQTLNGITEFTIGADRFAVLAATATNTTPPASYALYKFTDDSHNISTAEPLWFFPNNGMGTVTNGSFAAPVSVEVNEQIATIYLYSANNGYAAYTFTVNQVTISDDADNTTALVDYEGKTVTAVIKRNFTANNYMTLTLPFDMSDEQITQVFGNGAKVYELAKVVEGATEIHLQFRPTSVIEAGKPYILDINVDVNGFTIDNVEIDTELRPVNPEGGAITMVPVLDCDGSKLEQPTQYWLATDNYLYSAGAYPTDLLGLRAYFQSTSPLPVRARVVYNDNETTGLPTIEQPANDVRKIFKDGQIIIIRGEQQYNIQGQRMQ